MGKHSAVSADRVFCTFLPFFTDGERWKYHSPVISGQLKVFLIISDIYYTAETICSSIILEEYFMNESLITLGIFVLVAFVLLYAILHLIVHLMKEIFSKIASHSKSNT